MKLAHKGLIILLLPVAFELAFVFSVGDLLNQVDTQIAAETSGADGLMAVETLWLDVLRANYAAVSYHCTRDVAFIREHDSIMQDIATTLKTLRQVAGSDRKRHALVDYIVIGQTKQLRLRKMLMQSWEELGVSALLGGPKVMDNALARLNDDPTVDPMALQSRELEQASLQKQNQIYRTLHNVLFVGAGVSLLLTIITGALFYREIYVRLKAVIINIDRMIKRAPLIPPKPSHDELGELERAIIRTGEQIANLERLRSHNAKKLAEALLQSLDEITKKLEELKARGFDHAAPQIHIEETASDRIQSAQNLLDRLRFLLTDLLSIDEIYAARLKLQHAVASTTTIVNDALEATSAQAQSKHIQITANIKDIEIECDSTRITQVVINLVSNAIKFSPGNSEIIIECSDAAGYVTISVHDHGRGITPEFKERMFHRFEQATDADQQKGSGLGLSICRDLVEAHGGTMDFESEAGNTKFRIKLPLNQPKAEIPANAASIKERSERRPALLRTALTWLAIPAVVQLIVIASLTFLVDGAQQQMVVSRQAREVATRSADIARDLIVTSMKGILYNTQGVPDAVDRLKEREANIRSEIEQLKKLTQHDPEQFENTQRIEKVVDSELKSAYAIASHPEKDMKLTQLMKHAPGFGDRTERVPHVGTELEKTVNAIRKVSRSHPLATAESRATIYTVLLLGIAISVLASIAAAIVYSRLFCRRIDAIIQNTRRLTANEPLATPSANQDEIGEIDREFFAAAQHLKTLDRFKNELLSVTSHELRTPLTSLLGTFELLSTGMYGTLNETGTRLLDTARHKAAHLVSLITNFLDLEKMKSGKVLVSPQAVSLKELSDILSKQAAIAPAPSPPATGSLHVAADSERLLQAISAIAPAHQPPITLHTTSGGIELRIAGTPDNNDGSPDFLAHQVGLALCEEIARQHGGEFISDRSGGHRMKLPIAADAKA